MESQLDEIKIIHFCIEFDAGVFLIIQALFNNFTQFCYCLERQQIKYTENVPKTTTEHKLKMYIRYCVFMKNIHQNMNKKSSLKK
jgi:hypothetical protein